MDKTLALLNVPLLMEPNALASLIEAHRVRPMASVKEPIRHITCEDKVVALAIGAGYTTLQNGVAVVPIIGPIFKGYGSWGVADQTELRGHVRNAMNDPAVKAIMFLIDSPGGSVAGTQDLADDIRAASKVKPTAAYIEDLGASAAMWIAAACDEIYSNAAAMIGSVGVITAFADETKMYEEMGIQVHVVTTGAFKAAGSPFVKATPEHLQYIQSRTDSTFDQFVEAVAKGRGMRGETVRKQEARVYTAADAVEQKLSDGVMSFDQAFVKLSKRAGKMAASGKTRAQVWAQIEQMQNN